MVERALRTLRHVAAHTRHLLPPDIRPLLALAFCAGTALALAELADEVMEGGTHALDSRILLAMREPGALDDPLGPRWIEELGRDFTALGSMGVLVTLTLAAIGYLLLERKRRTALLILVSVGGGIALSVLLKHGFDRPRPDLVPHGAYVYTASFPSGHAMLAAVTYLTLGALLATTHARYQVKLYLMVLAITLTLIVGVSRVYLGVHWPTDVLAGWTAGALWAFICWQAAQWLRRRGQIEREQF